MFTFLQNHQKKSLKNSLLSLSLLAILTGCSTLSTTNALPKTSESNKTTTNAKDLRHEFVLDNGLKVIIKEDHRSPVVISQVWYNVGSNDEPEHLGGMSHLLEHMMFKGTNKVSSADFERLIAKFGGSNNAFTSYDYTAYYEVFPANRLNLALELEADRMKNLQLNQADFDSERQVVMEERRQRTDDDPNAQAFEQFLKMAYPTSPKGESVIGPMSEINAIQLNDLKHWYQTWYTPNNATVVIVGDVEPTQALQTVKKYFADIPSQPLPSRTNVREQGFRGYSEKTAHLPVKVPMLMMAYNLPTLTTTDDKKSVFALSLLSDILDGGMSARLEKRLVRERQILASVGSGYSAFSRGDGLLMIEATPRDGVSLEQAKQAILNEIENLKTEKIQDSELKRAKTNTMTSLIYSQDSLSGQAQMIGSLNSIGLDDRMIYELPTTFDKINEKQLKKVAKKYLVKDNLTVLKVIGDKKE
ncbi:M16 family metallopeptidase [Faucicola mancuniensis]|uniref:M16 family metallopeptidase n=1 Tax=Faucicola mancuniensis TaxID=1309795 RepID=UPI003977769E